MRNHFMSSTALLAFSSVAFAQTYGTKGYAPGAWKPDELPKDLAKPRPFDPHNLSGVWSMPSKGFEKHSLTSKPLDIKDPNVPIEMKQTSIPPPMTPWGKERLETGSFPVPGGTDLRP